MNDDNSPLEGMLRDSLGRQADRGAGTGPDLGGVMGRAKVIRRHRRQGTALAAAAAVAAIAIPSAFLLNNSPDASAPLPADHGTPTMAPSPSRAAESPSGPPSNSPSNSPSHTATTPAKTTTYTSLSAIPQGPAAAVSYLDLDGVVHGQGTTGRLPGDTASVTAFHDFRGGWVVERDLKITRYDQGGKVVGTGQGNGIRVSDDRVNVAWQSGRTVFHGPDNTMGEGGPAKATAPAGATLIGFLPYGPALAGDGNTIYTMDNGGKYAKQTIALMPTTTSQTANLVGGVSGSVMKSDFKGGVYDMGTHKVLWSNGWRPMAFSPDGKYVAAFPVYHNGDVGTWAILDARTGDVVAHTPKLKGIYLGMTPVWQDDDTLVFNGDTTSATTLLTLTPDGTFRRAGGIVQHANGENPFRFVAQP